MSDEPKKDEPQAEWTMPEPVFRSSEGHTPKGVHETLDTDEVDTEPGFHDAPTVEISNIETDEPPKTQEKPAKRKGKRADKTGAKITPTTESAEPKKKGGCFRKVLYIILAIALLTAAAIAALIYFVYYAVRSTDGLN